MLLTATSTAPTRRRFVVTWLALLSASFVLQTESVRAQPPRGESQVYPAGGSNDIPPPQRFNPNINSARPLTQPGNYQPVEGQRTSYSTPETQARPNTAASAPAPRSRQPILLSPRGKGAASKSARSEGDSSDERRQTTSARPNFLAILGSLGMVLGLFFVVVWVMRRGMPTAAKPLPVEVVEVLGRTPLAPRQHAHLIRCGNKMLLVALTADTATTLTEITDPLEVDRIAGLCGQSNPHSSSHAFSQILQQFASEKPATSWFDRLIGSRRAKRAIPQDLDDAVENVNA